MPEKLVLMMVAAAFISQVAYAANEDGSAVAVLENGRTLVPVRAAAEWLGAAVSWDASTHTVSVTRGHTTVRLQPGFTLASVNGKQVKLDVAPVVLAGVTYIPARFVSESLGAGVKCDGRRLTLQAADAGRTMELRVAARRGDWLTYRGPWFDIDYPASFRPVGYDHAPGSTEYDADGMSWLAPDGEVELYVYSPQWSGDPSWPTLWPGEVVTDLNVEAEGSGYARKRLTYTTIAGPDDAYMRSWLRIREGDTVEYYFGMRYVDQAARDRRHVDYARFKDSLAQFAD